MRTRPALGLLGLLLVVGLVVSRPLASEWWTGLPLSSRPPADRAVLLRASGDTLQLYYQLWLFRDGLLGSTPLFRDPYQFRTDGPRWSLPQAFLPLALPFTLLSALGSPAAYNLLVLLSFPFTGLAAYLLVRHVTGHPAGAVAAGAAFALDPARIEALFGGQPAGFAAGLVPLVLWGLDVALTRGRFGGGVAGGGALLALAMLEPQYTYLAGGLLVAYGVLRWRFRPPPRRLPLIPLLAFLALAAGGAGWLLLLRQVSLVGSIAEGGRSLGEVLLYSPGPAALGQPATYGGLVVAVLALVGFIAPGPRDRAWALFYGLVLTAGVILSLGPTLPGVPLYEALHRWAPLFALIRNPAKFRLLTSLGAAALAGLGVRALLTPLAPRAARWAGLALALAVVVGTAPWHPIAVTRLPDSPIYGALRAEGGRALYLPLWPGDNALSAMYLYHVTRTRVPIVNGYSPLVPRRYVAEVFRPLQGLNVGDLGPVEYALLHRLGVTHVVLDRALFPPEVSPFPSAFTRERLRASPGLALERAVDPLWVFRVTDRPPGEPPLATSPVGLFFEAEALYRDTGALAEEPAASGGRIVAARAGAARAGFLTFGPYRLLPAGAYRAIFRLRGSGLRAEVTVANGRRVLAERALEPRPAWDEVELPFEVDRAQAVEYRVRWDGTGEAAVDWVLVVFADRPQPEWTFEVEDLTHLLGERPDPAASGGWAGYADPVESRRIPLVLGPSRLYPAGRYRLWLRARAAGVAPGPLLTLAVREPEGRTLAARTVDADELRPGGYREVGLDFYLARPTVADFPVTYLGGTGLYLDRLTVTPQ
ncbi:MAG: hypothetical protein HY002_13920 [Candidatus Rokubacteria bacterium]|nr:hypothetical protein [Candidatus Rokubacteria bacterium]